MRPLALILAFLLFGGISNPVRNDRPNVIVIIADDMGLDPWSKGGVGTDLAATPNLDALADQGLTFSNTWATPTCSPTRAAILSGLYGTKNGVLEVGDQLDTATETLFEAIDRVTGEAYAIGAFGKWHIGPNRDLDNPNVQGADHYVGYSGGAPGDYYAWDQVTNGSSVATTDYLTSAITSAAIEWKEAQTKPWMIWMAHAAAHTPFHTPPDSLYSRATPSSDSDQYLSMIEAMDTETGRLLAALSPEERENTIIFFIGDNGTPTGVLQGYPNRRGKGTLYQGGLSVPMFVSGFGVDRVGETDPALVHVMDLHATILDLMGADVPGGVNNSFSLRGRLESANAPSRPYLISETTGNAGYGFAIRDDQYKVIQYASGETEFFDLLDDPFERRDLQNNSPTAAEQARRDELIAEATTQLNGWSCNDGIVNGAEDASSCMMQTGTELPEEAEPRSKTSVYPNPTSDRITVKLDSGALLGDVDIFTVTGRRVKNVSARSLSGQLDVPLSDLPAGPYVVRVRTGLNGENVQTLMVTKY